VSCDRLRPRLPLLFDDELELPERDELLAHLETCSSCAGRRVTLARLLESGEEPAPPPQEVWTRIAARLPGTGPEGASLPTDAPPGYHLLSPLDRTGERYLARRRDGEVVEVELLRLPQRQTERYLRDSAAVAQRVRHPNLQSFLEAERTADGGCFAVREHVPAGSLQDRIEAGGKLPPAEALSILISVAHGLRALHQDGILHRALKPEHVLLPPQGEAKLSGLARPRREELSALTAEGAMIGTPLYNAPEEGRRQLDARADLYALGQIFYTALAGHPALSGESPLAIFRGQAHGRIQPPSAELPPGYLQVLGRLLQPERERRYPDLEALLRDLEALQAGEPPTPGPSLWASSEGQPPAEGTAQRRWGWVALLLVLARLALALWVASRG
jgi:hypothetical protein